MSKLLSVLIAGFAAISMTSVAVADNHAKKADAPKAAETKVEAKKDDKAAAKDAKKEDKTAKKDEKAAAPAAAAPAAPAAK